MAAPSRSKPDFVLELDALDRGVGRVIGVDEVGRGPLAGPVLAAAVRLDPDRIPAGLDDSKRLTPARRAVLAAEIRTVAEVSIGLCTVEEIDALNILNASLEAMRRAMAALAPGWCLVDGNRMPPGLTGEWVVKGDSRSASIAAASIIAKEARDQIMRDLAQQHPPYNWGKNMGYGTAEHRAALAQHGPTQHHRRSFAPVRNMLCPQHQ